MPSAILSIKETVLKYGEQNDTIYKILSFDIFSAEPIIYLSYWNYLMALVQSFVVLPKFESKLSKT